MTGSCLGHGCDCCSSNIAQAANFICRTCAAEHVHRSSFNIFEAVADCGTGFMASCIDAGPGLDRQSFVQKVGFFYCIVKMDCFLNSSGSRSFPMYSDTGSDFVQSVYRCSSACDNLRILDFGSVAASFSPGMGLSCTLGVPCSAADSLRVGRDLETGVENRAGNLFVVFDFNRTGMGSVP